VSRALEDRRALITGATANIGAATARLFAQEGARLVLVDRDPAIEETAAGIRESGGDAHAVVADVSSADEVDGLVRVVDDALGGLDVLVNNAAIQRVGAVEAIPVEEWDEIFAINVRGYFLMVRALVPALRASEAASIVNTSSQTGQHGAPGATAYSATKGAVIAFTKALALELAADGIRVNAIAPGWVDTAFNTPAITMLGGADAHGDLVRATIPLGRQARPEEIAAGSLYLASAQSSYMTGQVLAVDGGLT
jgi:dihydroanticapsin dehydrogenase